MQDVDAVAVGKVHVEQNDIRREVGEDGAALARSHGRAHFPLVGQQSLETCDDVRIVINDQQALPYRSLSHVQKSYSRIVPKQPRKRQTHLSF